MKSYFLLLPVFFFALLEGTIITIPLTFLTVLAWAAWEENFFGAFICGLFLDLLKGNPLGTSSLIFLLATLTIFLYKRKFKATNFAYFLPFTFLASLLYIYLGNRAFLPREAFLSSLLAFPVASFVFWFLEKVKSEGQLKLKV